MFLRVRALRSQEKTQAHCGHQSNIAPPETGRDREQKSTGDRKRAGEKGGVDLAPHPGGGAERAPVPWAMREELLFCAWDRAAGSVDASQKF